MSKITKATAYHEAGHAVAHWYTEKLTRKCSSVHGIHAVHGRRNQKIIDRKGREVIAMGLTERTPHSMNWLHELMPNPHGVDMFYAGLRLDLMVIMAGPYAEARVSKKSRFIKWLASIDDYDLSEKIAENLPEGRLSFDKAEKVISNLFAEHWGFIDEVAKLLIQTGYIGWEDFHKMAERRIGASHD